MIRVSRILNTETRHQTLSPRFETSMRAQNADLSSSGTSGTEVRNRGCHIGTRPLWPCLVLAVSRFVHTVDLAVRKETQPGITKRDNCRPGTKLSALELSTQTASFRRHRRGGGGDQSRAVRPAPAPAATKRPARAPADHCLVLALRPQPAPTNVRLRREALCTRSPRTVAR